MKKKYFILLIFVILFSSAFSQNVSTLWKDTKDKVKHPIKISGELSTNHVYYNAWGGDLRLQPYSYYIIGTMNIDLFSTIKIPISFRYTNQQFNFQKPQFQSFNNFGIAPYYKWLKLYLGYNTMNFSNYVMATPFTGVGVVLTPGKLHVLAMYGRFSKAILPDSINSTIPVYKRLGYAFKIAYGTSSDYIGISAFKAKDDTTSLNYTLTTKYNLKPQDNFVFSIEAGKKLFSKLFLKTEFANSVVTDNVYNPQLVDYAKNFNNFGFYFIDPKASTGSYYAYKGSLIYSMKQLNVGLNFEHVDAGYVTLGAPYFNSDIERISLLFSTSILKEKVKVDLNVGHEKNNLSMESISSSKKINYAININFIPVQRLNFMFNYTNFTSMDRIQSNFQDINHLYFDNLDTLNYSQVAQNANFTSFIMLSKSSNKKLQQNLMLNLNYQQASDIQNSNEQNITENTNLNLAYIFNIVPAALNFSCSFNGNYSKISGLNNLTLGPTLAINKSFFKRTLNNTLSVAWNQTKTNNVVSNDFLSARFNTSVAIKKHHTFSISLIYADRKDATLSKLKEFTGTFNYAFRF